MLTSALMQFGAHMQAQAIHCHVKIQGDAAESSCKAPARVGDWVFERLVLGNGRGWLRGLDGELHTLKARV